jgi:large subunit ribosomal protein L10
MPKTRDQKEQIAQNITEKLARSKSVVFADYKTLTMSELSDLRAKLAETGAEFSVTKNNLVKIGLKNNNLPVDDAALAGPTATLFAFEEEITPIKILTKALKDAQKGSVKGGILDGEFLDQTKVNRLADLPSKDELRAKVVGTLAAPLYGTVNVLQANLRNLVYALDQIRISKGGE